MLARFGCVVAAAFTLVGVTGGFLTSRNASGVAGCIGLASMFPQKLFWPNTTTYINESTPKALKVIRETNSPFAVRSGGHMPVPGAASTDNGIMIAMTNINTRNLIHNQSIAQLGPGQIWQDVYDWISAYDLGVAGGRYGQVGVGGLLTGGGINYFGNRFGWSFNSIVQYEVVVADSSILQVNASSHPDLFWALKGGSNNFGIVTRFDMKTFPVTTAYVGGIVWIPDALPAFLEAVGNFVQPGGGSEDPLVAINPAIALTPANGTVEPTNIVFYQGNETAPATLANFSVIPGTLFNDTGVRPSWISLPAELNQPAFAARTSRQLFWSVGIKPTQAAINLANVTIVGGALSQLQHIPDLTLTLAYQPITKAWLAAARASGGDAIDLDPADGGFISILISATWSHATDDADINGFMRSATSTLIQQAKAANLYYPFITLNDAGRGQDPYPLTSRQAALN
ncbi:MAG: hypothetical protein Q9187_000388 [Circinaria calcarea]